MNRPLLVALAAVSLTHAEAALAGSICGGGSSSGGGSSVSFSSSSSSSSDSSSSSTPSCTDDTDIVGHRKCQRFAAWSTSRRIPLIIIELGTAMRTFQSPLGETTGHLEHDSESFTYRVVGKPTGPEPASPDTAVVSTMRIGFGLPRGLYLATDIEIGGLTRTAGRAEMTSTGMFGAPSITPGTGLLIGAAAVVGVRGELGPTTVGVEAVGGTRSIAYTYKSHYLSCVTTETHGASMPILEARARAALWLSPFVNFGASAGASVIERGSWVAGVHLGIVSQAYGNQRD